jgi:predicted DNA-binding transcriptional regulator YafY
MKSNIIQGVLLNRFGKGIPITPTDKEGWSETHVEVALSDQFLGWIFSLGTKVKILEPEEVIERYTRELAAMSQMYK